jgi:LPXTG-motif cell wall-anchored protein
VTLSGSASSTSGPTSVDAAPASRATLNTGSPLPVIVGGAVGLLLLAAAGAYAWRRSRTG